MKKPKTDLFDIHLQEVSLVDRGANKKKRFPIWKQEDELKTFEEILKAVLLTEVDEEADFEKYFEKEKLSDKGAQAVKAALRLLSAFKDEIPQDAFLKLSKLVGFDKPEMEEEEEKQEEDEKNKSIKKEGKETMTHIPESVQKELLEQKTTIELLKKQVATSTEELQKANDERLMQRWIDRIEKELSSFPEDPGQLAKTFFELEKINKQLASAQFESMKKANEVVKQSKLFETIGTKYRATDAKGVMSKYEQKVQELVSKSDKFTYEQAMAEVIKTNPELYNEYLNENSQQN